MEWAWKPMAAMMNDQNTDLVYWVPPLYASNIINSISCSSGTSSARSSISSIQSASLRRRLSQISTVSSSSFPAALPPSPIRKKKLSRTRGRMRPDQLRDMVLVEEDPSAMKDSSQTDLTKPEVKDEDTESGIHEATNSLTEEIPIQEKPIPSPVSQPRRRSRRQSRKMSEVERQIHLLARQIPKPRHSIPEDAQVYMREKRRQSSNISAILKVIDKVSSFNNFAPFPCQKDFPFKKKEKVLSTNQKPKRPSVKIYSASQKRQSFRNRNQDSEMSMSLNSEPPCLLITRRPSIDQSVKDSPLSEGKGDSDQDNSSLTGNNLKNAQLEVLIKILSNLYEDTISKQGNEIQLLKTKVQIHDKIMKKTARCVLELKQELEALKNPNSDRISVSEIPPPLIEEGIDIGNTQGDDETIQHDQPQNCIEKMEVQVQINSRQNSFDEADHVECMNPNPNTGTDQQKSYSDTSQVVVTPTNSQNKPSDLESNENQISINGHKTEERELVGNNSETAPHKDNPEIVNRIDVETQKNVLSITVND